ncbi:AAA family ATPase [Glycomyces sp. NPDC048151]|uniref:AAA family ATPase n=1 Tax=Glycomyces sp. NPDC048151 TaxID=3364002 RepID=UPI00371417AE
MFDHEHTPPPPEDTDLGVFAPPKRRVAWSATDLMDAEFPEPKWAVPGMICEGVNLFCGPPKVGKSWASLGLGLDIAAGGVAFGSIPVNAGPVLYLALEDTARRLQSRMRTLLAGNRAPEQLTIVTECPRLDNGGAEMIDGWLTAHPTARLVVVDVFAKIRPAAAHGSNAYDADYAAIGAIKRLADKHAVAFLVVHHVRKAGSDDFLSEVSGTNGIAGAADATLVLKRGRGKADGLLHITGRDVEEVEHAFAFDPARGAWRLLDGDPRKLTESDNLTTVYDWLLDNPESGPAAIAAGTGIKPESVKTTLKRGSEKGWLFQKARGRWTAVENTTADELF